MDLSSIGYAPKEFRVIQVHERSISKDFLAGKFRALAVECNVKSYNSSLQLRLKSIFPNLARHMETVVPDRNLLGQTVITNVNTHSQDNAFIANMFVATGCGLGRSGTNKSETPVNRFSEKFLTESFRDLVALLRPRMLDLDRQIAVPRFYGGLGGVEWADVVRVLDTCCEEHRINILAYLPKDYDKKFVRGTA